ncbi:MAG: metal-dependent transcriptional regulator [Promethearchaeota archaeon]
MSGSVETGNLPDSYRRYLETVYRLERGEGRKARDPVRNVEIADYLGVRPPSVTEMLEKLDKLGLVVWTKRKGVKLSRKGEEVAKRVIRSHIYLELFFREVLDIEDEVVLHEVSSKIQNHVNDRLYEALEKLLGVDGYIRDELDASPRLLERVDLANLLFGRLFAKALDRFASALKECLPAHRQVIEEVMGSVLGETPNLQTTT